jgi:hypothetical protein
VISPILYGYQTADKLARLGYERSFVGPEPACLITAGFAKKAAKNFDSEWTNRVLKNTESLQENSNMRNVSHEYNRSKFLGSN